jgi:hypothetical protein
MRSSTFFKVLYPCTLAAILSFFINDTSHKANAETSDYPLLSIKLLIVPEDVACAPFGYGEKCIPLTYNDVKLQLKGEMVTEFKDIPANSKVFLGNRLRAALFAYSKFRYKQPFLSARDSKSVVAVFDFGELSRKYDFNVNIDWWQPAGKGCEGEQLQAQRYSYQTQLSSDYRYVLYHAPADLFVPCSNVTWTLKVTEITEKGTGKQYSPWTFRMLTKDN